MDKKIKLALICGGISSERDISLSTGMQIYKNLNKDKYDIVLIDSANLPGTNMTAQAKESVEIDAVAEVLKDVKNVTFGSLVDVAGCDVAFIALHGKYGEDGTIQGYLELMGLPYTGSDTLASALCMNKSVAKRILRSAGLTVADSVDFNTEKPYDFEDIKARVDAIGYPVMVKPSRQGSTVGMTKVDKGEDLKAAVETAEKYDSLIVIEKFVSGTELSVSVIDFDGRPMALPIAEIVPESGAYDYYSKYAVGATNEIVPARLSEEQTKEAKEAAEAAYEAAGCSGAARVDIIFDGKDMYILEINTIPGMTPTSLLPRSAEAQGIDFPTLLDKIIESALRKR